MIIKIPLLKLILNNLKKKIKKNSKIIHWYYISDGTMNSMLKIKLRSYIHGVRNQLEKGKDKTIVPSLLI